KKGDPGAVNVGKKGPCFICLPNISIIQRGMRLFALGGLLNFVFLVQPFPILSAHVTLASARHTPQILSQQDVNFLLDATQRSAEFSYTYNSIGAGASIEEHLHFHVFRYRLPIEDIEVEVISESKGLKVGRLGLPWPILTLVFEGEKEKVNASLWSIVDEAQKRNKPFNILSTHNSQGKLKVYFIPRRRETPLSTFAHALGVVEMAGFILTEKTSEFSAVTEDKDI
ncbi:unnamed protein product, partial [marine sediment metagenome]